MPGKRKQIRNVWKAARKVQLQMNRRKKAIRAQQEENQAKQEK